jgi:hypothetical protein
MGHHGCTKVNTIVEPMHKETQNSPTNITCIHLPMFEILKVKTKVELLDLIGKVICVVGEICAMSRMTFHGGFIALGHYSMVVTRIKRGSMKLPFLVT